MQTLHTQEHTSNKMRRKPGSVRQRRWKAPQPWRASRKRQEREPDLHERQLGAAKEGHRRRPQWRRRRRRGAIAASPVYQQRQSWRGRWCCGGRQRGDSAGAGRADQGEELVAVRDALVWGWKDTKFFCSSHFLMGLNGSMSDGLRLSFRDTRFAQVVRTALSGLAECLALIFYGIKI